MRKVKILLIVLLLATLISLVTACTPRPQSVTVVVINAPEDLRISFIAMYIVDDEESEHHIRPWVSDRLWETYYRYSFCCCFCCCLSAPPLGWSSDEFKIRANSEEYGEFEVTLPILDWQDISVRLDLETQTISPAYTHVRNLLILLLWLASLFVFDSIVFFLFGYRKKQSWKLFIRENLLMHMLFMFVWVLFHTNVFGSLPITIMLFIYILGARIAKWVIEVKYYRNKIEEHSNARGVACAVTMNTIGIAVVILLGIHIPLPGI